MKHRLFVATLAGAFVMAAVPALESSTPAPVPVLQDVPAAEAALGTVRIGRRVMADGKSLGPGTYQVRLTAQTAQPAARGASNNLERWVEFVQGGQVRGREVVSIVPGEEIAQVAKTNPPAAGNSRVELLKGNEYLRVWINRSGTHYLIHLPVQG